jgi:hypothetical protein
MKTQVNLILEISEDVQKKLFQFTKEIHLENAIQKIASDLIETKLAYWSLIDKQFQEKKGMSFEEYEDTKRDEWDGSDWIKIEEYHDWECAIAGIEYYEAMRELWKFQNLNQS